MTTMSDAESDGVNSAAAVEPESGRPDVELVRVIDRTIHVSEVDRRKETDHTVRNNSDEEVNYVFLPLREFKLNLEVHDEDGRQLNFFPNAEVAEMVDRARNRDENLRDRLKHRFGRAK